MEKFEIDSCRQWIEDNQFTVIALQVPDEDLAQVQNLIDSLTSAIANEKVEFFLVGDGCSPCCNDLINAQYCQAQALIHFGHSCLTTLTDENSPKIAIFYVFYQQALPEDVSLYLSADRQDGDKPYLLVFYDPCFRDAMKEYSTSTLTTHLVISNIASDNRAVPQSFSLYGRSVDLPVPLNPSNYSVVFISHSKASLNNFTLYFYAYEFRSFPSNPLTSQRLLSKRMYAIECARNGSTFGLLLSSNSLLNLPTTIHRLLDHVKSLLDRNDRSYHTFLMNTLSIAKMNNFEQNIDTFVLCSSCSESLWLSPEHRQFNIPMISVIDVIQALEEPDEQSPRSYSFDLREILSTMKTIDDQSAKDNEGNQAIVLKHPNALLLQQHDGNNRGLNGGRSWWGLQMNSDVDEKEKEPVAELKEGRSGIAAGYTHETS